MRKDENGNNCPETLGEYYDLCLALGGNDCEAVFLLEEKIKKQGRDEKVIAPDSQMRFLLLPLILKKTSKVSP